MQHVQRSSGMSNKASVLFSFSRKLKVFLKRLQNKKLLRRSKDFFFLKNKQTQMTLLH